MVFSKTYQATNQYTAICCWSESSNIHSLLQLPTWAILLVKYSYSRLPKRVEFPVWTRDLFLGNHNATLFLIDDVNTADIFYSALLIKTCSAPWWEISDATVSDHLQRSVGVQSVSQSLQLTRTTLGLWDQIKKLISRQLITIIIIINY